MKKKITLIAAGIGMLMVLALAGFLFAGTAKPAKSPLWGVGFSQKHAMALQVDWQKMYLAMLDDLQVKYIKTSVDWDLIEPKRDEFYFHDIDWQVEQAKNRNAHLLPVFGMKTLRWPECHLPEWAKGLSKEEQQEEVLEIVEAVVSRYKDSSAVWAWQVENEPLLRFGQCPWKDKDFLESEIELARQLDASRRIVISDSGELSLWMQAAQVGDIVSTTMYRKVWFHEFGKYVEYPLPAVFYTRKAKLIDFLYGKEVLVGELQAEPWGPGKLLYDTTIEEQELAFDLAQFDENVEYALDTGFDRFYLWGAEWWYWRKEEASDARYWDKARSLFLRYSLPKSVFASSGCCEQRREWKAQKMAARTRRHFYLPKDGIMSTIGLYDCQLRNSFAVRLLEEHAYPPAGGLLCSRRSRLRKVFSKTHREGVS